MNNCGTGALMFDISLPRDCHACVRNDKFFRLRPKEKLIRSVLIDGMFFSIFNLLYITNATKQMKNKEKPLGASPNVL